MTSRSSEQTIKRFSEFLAKHMGLRFPPERSADLLRGIASASREFGFSDTDACMEWLMRAPLSRNQVEILASHLTIGETYFFRDPKVFTYLEKEYLPKLIHMRRHDGKYLRVWSAGCATGEEAYTVAIILSRLLPDMGEWKPTILATDINPAFLGKAATGEYGEWSFRSVTPNVKERYFSPCGNRCYRIAPHIRRMVTFSYLNLADDPFPSLTNNTSAMDLILCRNVIMYFSRRQQEEVIRKFHRCLVPHGLLAVSAAEMSTSLFSGFVQGEYRDAAIYRKGEAGTGTVAIGGSVERPRDLHHRSVVPAPHGQPPERINPAPLPPVSPPQDAIGLCREAEEEYHQGRYGEAERILSTIPALETDICALALLARVRANSGKLHDALFLLEKAVGMNKLDAGLHYLMATVLLETGRREEAAAAFRRALYLDQDLAVAHFSLGIMALQGGRPKEAERHFENALASMGKLPPATEVPHSDGITAERLREIVETTRKEQVPA